MIKVNNKEIQAVISTIVNRLVASFDVEKIVLFGSYVSGKQTKDSDIDLFVLLNTRKKGIERYAMVSEVLEPRKIPMDLIVKTPAEIRKRKNYFDPFIRNIEMNGKVLYEKKVCMTCDICGKKGAQVRRIPRTYGKGKNILVIENVPVITCPNCGESYLEADTLHEIERIKLHRKSFAEKRTVPVANFA